MNENREVVHVHVLDEEGVIEEYRRKGYVLIERSKPSIIAQAGFQKLTFVPADSVEAIPDQAEESSAIFSQHPSKARPAIS